VLALDGVEVVYNRVALVLKGVSLQVAEGSVVALLGGNGAGKTTTLKAVSGLLAAERGDVTRGQISWQGESIARLTPPQIVSRGLVQVLEGRRVFEHLSCEDNLLVGAHTAGGPRAGRQAGYLSGGEQQMLAIGRALMARPKVMLLDEPSLGLAPVLVNEIFEIVARLNREEGVTVLVVEQNAEAALAIAHHGYVMEDGRVVLEGPAADLARNQDVAEFYLGLSGVGDKRSYRDLKTYRRRKRWLG
jgi:branched-chain amino acid transport system ATP-binding protein